MDNIILDNGKIVIEIERENGRIIQFDHKLLAINLVQEPRLAENFRIMLPLPYLRAHYILGKDQKLANAHVENNRCQLTWDGLDSASGHFDIRLTQTITLDGDDATFSMDVENRSPYIIEEIFNVALGGMSNFAEREDWRLHWANWGGQGSEWAFYDVFPGSYLGPSNPVWTAMYHKELSMPWVSLYNEKTRRGVYIGNHDREIRHSMVFAQLFPSTVYRHAQSSGIDANVAQGWPDPAIAGDVPIGLTLGWNNFPFLKQNESWSGPPIVFHFHSGIWWDAADYFRAWYDTHTTLDKSDSWLSNEDAWQSTIISYPDDVVGFRFADLPQVARDAKAAGINVIQIDGWDIGGLDRGYPQYLPDPRLGTWEEFEQAIAECAVLGVYVLVFSNLQWINIETDWFKDELHRYAIRDPHGNMRGGMGWEYNTSLGQQKQPIYRMIHANMARPEIRRILVDQLMNVVRLGAPGTQIDKLGAMWEFDYSPDSPLPTDRATMQGVLDSIEEYYQRSRLVNPNFRIASEVHWDRIMPFVDAAYARFFNIDHKPTYEHTFPEYRSSCCITGDYDFGLVNNSLRFGHIINVEARCLHGTAADVPQLARYVAEALRIRRELRDVLWDSRVIEPVDVQVEGDVLVGLHESRVNSRQALVLNHFKPEDVSAKVTHLKRPGAATLYRPFKVPESIILPATITVPRDEFAILIFE